MSVGTLKFYPSVSISYLCCHFDDSSLTGRI